LNSEVFGTEERMSDNVLLLTIVVWWRVDVKR
jgi:hypothetical protein